MAQYFLQLQLKGHILHPNRLAEVATALLSGPLCPEHPLHVFQPSKFLVLQSFEVVRPDMVPQLPEEPLIGVVVGVGERVADFKKDAA